MKASSHAWHTLYVRACILYKWLFLCTLLRSTVQYGSMVPLFQAQNDWETSIKAAVIQLALLNFSRYCTVKLKVSVFVFACFYVLFIRKSIINLQYSTI